MKFQLLTICIVLSLVSSSMQLSILGTIGSIFGRRDTSIEMPDYTVLETKENNVEIREYAPSKWVSGTFEGQLKSLRSKRSATFRKLFSYIRGGNDQSKKIEMTAPVKMQMSSASEITEDSNINMTMSFYVPKVMQDSTPIPTDDTLKVVNMDKTTFATIRFSGRASTNDQLEHRDKLIKALGDEASQYDTVNMIIAGYDAPFVIFNRRNEVWLRKL